MTSDVISNSPLFHKQIQGNLEGELVINQMPLSAFFHAPKFQPKRHAKILAKLGSSNKGLTGLVAVTSPLMCANLNKHD